MQNRRSVFAARIVWRVGPHGDVVAILPSANPHQSKYGVCGRYNVMFVSSSAVRWEYDNDWVVIKRQPILDCLSF